MLSWRPASDSRLKTKTQSCKLIQANKARGHRRRKQTPLRTQLKNEISDFFAGINNYFIHLDWSHVVVVSHLLASSRHVDQKNQLSNGEMMGNVGWVAEQHQLLSMLTYPKSLDWRSFQPTAHVIFLPIFISKGITIESQISCSQQAISLRTISRISCCWRGRQTSQKSSVVMSNQRASVNEK